MSAQGDLPGETRETTEQASTDTPDTPDTPVTPDAPAATAGATPGSPHVPAQPGAPDLPSAGAPASDWGRVAEDGTVFLRTLDGERAVGQYPEGSPEEALAFFTRRYDALAFEVQLLEQRVHAGALSPDEATESVKRVSGQVSESNAVGDLVGLTARLDALMPLIGVQRGKRREDRARRQEESRGRKTAIVEEAEKISQGQDWRNGVNRLRDLLEEWKALPRLEKKADDELWHRFSSARTQYTRRRKAHFSELNDQREGAKVVKQRILAEAEQIKGSTEWGPTSTRFRQLMQQWKAAGAAPRDVEDQLWQQFRAAQDVFFGARDAANAAQDQEFAANAEVKEKLLVEAEALLPVQDLDAAKRAFRDIADRWDAAGKVPRDQIKTLEGRMRRVEQAIRSVEDERWQRSDPEKSARADDLLGQLERQVADLEATVEKARAAGDERAVKRAEADLASRQAFLDAARKAADDYR